MIYFFFLFLFFYLLLLFLFFFFFLMIRRPPRSTLSSSSAASDVYKRQDYTIMWRELAGVNQAADGATALRSLELAFYSPLSDQERAAWSSCLDDWLRLQRSEPGSAAERAHMMKQASPKYVPREWLLVEVYKAAIAGDRAPLEEMMEVMSKPYDEHPQMEERFYRKCPPELLGKGGIAHMT
eukprot:TRINITY_DN22702_c0_g1_i1.p1 TRINITY_DN22702_c0_g1~~TRINITY_DN22702_c0_g1_i1.p1  ORF type:complete len:182 (+),score=53.35 TRINITY_DN22702_c0_g1_i1:58-603(+)